METSCTAGRERPTFLILTATWKLQDMLQSRAPHSKRGRKEVFPNSSINSSPGIPHSLQEPLKK